MKIGYTEKPYEALLELLNSRGIYRLGLKHFLEYRKAESIGFQYVAVEMLVREYSIIYDSTFRGRVIREENFKGLNFKLLIYNGSEKADSIVSRTPVASNTIVTWKELSELLPSPPLPAFVIDLSILAARGDDGSIIRVQIQESLEKIREYLWDPHLAITSSDRSFIEWVNMIAGRNKVTITQSKPSELLWSMDADKVIIVRQDAPHPITPNDILSSEAFLLGVSQDNIPRPEYGRLLDNLVPWGLPRRIELKNSIVGVPDSLNKIIEVILKARYKYNGDIEKAIITSMTQKNITTRLYYEIVKRAKRDLEGPSISWDLYYELSKWLPITKLDFTRVAEKAGIKIKG
ncbi:MAG: tRNA (guanine-N1)-methyltransferase [Acidilobaceae archaeon]